MRITSSSNLSLVLKITRTLTETKYFMLHVDYCFQEKKKTFICTKWVLLIKGKTGRAVKPKKSALSYAHEGGYPKGMHHHIYLRQPKLSKVQQTALLDVCEWKNAFSKQNEYHLFMKGTYRLWLKERIDSGSRDEQTIDTKQGFANKIWWQVNRDSGPRNNIKNGRHKNHIQRNVLPANC
eukprot:TRINITY_DN2574_c2_g1_i1.p1 TRINITY_DN2574_c2_g1~~TRINITY_DN2574_c2_g1_i1.p1  ORF type:complete len:180 (-),score=17.34 TRINITY_DN2574_c2_g1_i1:559-1098(-)